jgi:NAD(P)-dependent dehydrogenase (short-subunit alcohol dehydrogenase family)
MGRLEGKRVLVVGASSGIGRAIAVAAAEEGARVAVAARRQDALETLAAEIGGGAFPVDLDVCDEASCDSSVARAAEQLGGLDGLVYAVGIAYMHHITDVDAAAWHTVLSANVTGAALVASRAVPHLEATRGRAIFLSSISADDFPPRRALGPYMVSKAALNKLVEVLQAEHKAVSFTRVSVGDTAPTDFASGWDMSAAGEIVMEWGIQGFMFGRAMQPESVAAHVADLLAANENVAVTRIVPHYET